MIKIIKPMSLGVLHKPYMFLRQNKFVVAGLAFFPLGEENPNLLVDTDQWPKVMARLPKGQPLDMIMPKPRGEVLAAGSAYAPDQTPVPAMEVRIAVAGIDKRLHISGDRQWLYGLVPLHQITAPEPFTEMAIDYSRAYGGKGYKHNPLGCGYAGRLSNPFFGINQGVMPNVELASGQVSSQRRHYAPAGFGPLDIGWPQRQRKAGSYGRSWLKEDYPGLARDIDWTLFNAAPDDQQLPGFFEGGEAYLIEGMHPGVAQIRGCLPAMRARSFIQRQIGNDLKFIEVPLVADTVWFFPDQMLGVMVYHGQTDIDDSDALDVKTLMVAYERSVDAPRSESHYREVMALRLNPETALLHALNQSQLTPEKSAAEKQALADEQQQAEAEDLAKRQQLLDENMDDFWAQSGMEKPAGYQPPKAEPLPVPMINPQALARGDVDLSETLAKAKAVAQKAKEEGEARLAELEQKKKNEIADAQAQAEGLVAPKSPEEKKTALYKQVMVSGSGNAAMEEAIAAAGDSIDEAKAAQIRQGLADAAEQQRRQRQVAPDPTRPLEPLSDEEADYLGELIRELVARGESLAGRDLAGARLHGFDLSGLDMHGVMLEQADLTGCRFHNARLGDAVLCGAKLDGADFSDADLSAANLCKATGRGVCFRGAVLNKAMLMESDLAAADFVAAELSGVLATKARFEGTDFSEAQVIQSKWVDAKLADTRWCRAQLDKTAFIEADLTRADFSDARMIQGVLINVAADKARFCRAHWRKVQAASKASFKDADFSGMDAAQCGWRGVDLSGASFKEATIAKCDLGQARLQEADLTRAVFYRSMLMQADLSDVRAEEVDLFEAMCRKTNFSRADLRRANLFGAELSEARFDDADLRDIYRGKRGGKVA